MNTDFQKARLRKVERLLREAFEELQQAKAELAAVGREQTIQRACHNVTAAIIDTEDAIQELNP